MLGGGLGGKGGTPGGADHTACWLRWFILRLLLLQNSRQAITTDADDAGGGEAPCRHKPVDGLRKNWWRGSPAAS